MKRLWHLWRIRRYVEKCKGDCEWSDPHSHHLTKAGLAHYAGIKP